jgi:hypothetical protein
VDRRDAAEREAFQRRALHDTMQSSNQEHVSPRPAEQQSRTWLSLGKIPDVIPRFRFVDVLCARVRLE